MEPGHYPVRPVTGGRTTPMAPVPQISQKRHRSDASKTTTPAVPGDPNRIRFGPTRDRRHVRRMYGVT